MMPGKSFASRTAVGKWHLQISQHLLLAYPAELEDSA